MSKQFAVFDIDGTLFRSGLYRELVFELDRARAIPESVRSAFEDKKQAWHERKHGNAFREYEQAMVDALNSVLPKINPKDLEAAARLVVKAQRNNVYFYTRDLVKQLKAQDYFLIAISGSQKELLDEFAPYYEFDVWLGQGYEQKNGKYTGKIFETHHNKHTLLKNIVEKHSLSYTNSIACGDSGGDIDLLLSVDKPIAFNPDQKLVQTAKENGWPIVVERKNVTYRLEFKESSHVLAETVLHQ